MDFGLRKKSKDKHLLQKYYKNENREKKREKESKYDIN